MLRPFRCVCLSAAFVWMVAPMVAADEKDGRLDIYFIDVEGGASTLLVTPAGESMLIDTGFPDNGGRDRDRVLKVVRDVAGRKELDHITVSHWHLDHYGNHAVLSTMIPIKNFWDRGIPESLSEDRSFPDRIANYRSASQNMSKPLKAGDMFPLKSGATPLTVKVLTASGETIPNAGPPNPYASEHKPQPEDTSDNARSISYLFSFGPFRFLTCGDLTWNTEAKLMTPNNPIGKVDLFMVTHHGANTSNNPVLVKAIEPTVTVMNNGPTKGGDLLTMQTLKGVKSIQAAFQLHRAVRLKPEEQTSADLIANTEPAGECKAVHIKASVAPDGKSFTVQIGDSGKVHTFQTK
jgi:beta-lactamase superfamily II metal-dependent hydrolase